MTLEEEQKIRADERNKIEYWRKYIGGEFKPEYVKKAAKRFGSFWHNKYIVDIMYRLAWKMRRWCIQPMWAKKLTRGPVHLFVKSGKWIGKGPQC